MPIYLVGLRALVHSRLGVGWCLLTANFPLVDIEFKSSGLGSVSASISYPSGFVFPPPFGGGQDIYGEFDPGSGRTLAACLTHASRTVIRVLVPGDQWRTGE
jgi:hypothetical protein